MMPQQQPFDVGQWSTHPLLQAIFRGMQRDPMGGMSPMGMSGMGLGGIMSGPLGWHGQNPQVPRSVMEMGRSMLNLRAIFDALRGGGSLPSGYGRSLPLGAAPFRAIAPSLDSPALNVSGLRLMRPTGAEMGRLNERLTLPADPMEFIALIRLLSQLP